MSGTCSRCDTDITYGLCDECHEAADNKAADDLTASRDMIAALEHERDVARRERDEARKLLGELVAGADEWAADEDGVHPDAWEAYREARTFLGLHVSDDDGEKTSIVCATTHVQNCHACGNLQCGDNTSRRPRRQNWPQRTEYLAAEGARRWRAALTAAWDVNDLDRQLSDLVRVGVRAVQVGQ